MASTKAIQHLADQVQLVSRKSREVAAAFNAPGGSSRASLLLLAEIASLAAAHENVMVGLRDELSPLDPFLEAAEKISGHWRALSSSLTEEISARSQTSLTPH